MTVIMNSEVDFPSKKVTFLVVLAAIVTAFSSIYGLEWLAKQSTLNGEKTEIKQDFKK